MFLQHKKLVLSGMILVLLLLLVACSSAGNSINGNTGTKLTRALGLTNLQQLLPPLSRRNWLLQSHGGSAGKGPVVISSPTPVPGGKAGAISRLYWATVF